MLIGEFRPSGRGDDVKLLRSRVERRDVAGDQVREREHLFLLSCPKANSSRP